MLIVNASREQVFEIKHGGERLLIKAYVKDSGHIGLAVDGPKSFVFGRVDSGDEQIFKHSKSR